MLKTTTQEVEMFITQLHKDMSLVLSMHMHSTRLMSPGIVSMLMYSQCNVIYGIYVCSLQLPADWGRPNFSPKNYLAEDNWWRSSVAEVWGPDKLCAILQTISCILVLERCGLLKERSILIDFRGKNRGFDFNFWLPKCEQYTGLTKKCLPSPLSLSTLAISAAIVADFGHYSHQKRQL